jgi:hypothetical protein
VSGHATTPPAGYFSAPRWDARRRPPVPLGRGVRTVRPLGEAQAICRGDPTGSTAHLSTLRRRPPPLARAIREGHRHGSRCIGAPFGYRSFQARPRIAPRAPQKPAPTASITTVTASSIVLTPTARATRSASRPLRRLRQCLWAGRVLPRGSLQQPVMSGPDLSAGAGSYKTSPCGRPSPGGARAPGDGSRCGGSRPVSAAAR